MEIIRKTPGKIYAKSNTNSVVKLLVFLSAILVVLVCGVCVFVVLHNVGNTPSEFLDESQAFYYSVNGNTARLEKFVDYAATTFTIPGSVRHDGKDYPLTELSAQSFNNCHHLTRVKIGNAVTKIGGDVQKQRGAFAGCVNLQTIEWGNSVTQIEEYAFKNCLALTTITLPASVQFVQPHAFMNNLAATKLVLNSGGQCAVDCLTNCVNITALEIGADVTLTAAKRELLAGLNQLTTFDVGDNPNYQVVDGCILSADGQRLVVGGTAANLPASVKHIEDWACGARYGTAAVFVPATVEILGQNSFAAPIIYTDYAGLSAPINWVTASTTEIRYAADEITFYPDHTADDTPRKAYVYTNKDGEIIMPVYNDLFLAPADNYLYAGWLPVNYGDHTCRANYVERTVATSGEKDALTTASQTVASHLTTPDPDLRLRFTLDYWEKIKLAYARATALVTATAPWSDLVTAATTEMQTYGAVLADPEHAAANVLADQNWRVGLSTLLRTVAELDAGDFVDDDKWSSVQDIAVGAERLLADSQTSALAGRNKWLALRAAYENLHVNPQTLNALITECDTLTATDYTAASWESLTQALAAARPVATYQMLSISAVRQQLTAARQGLVSSAIATDTEFLTRAAWVGVCRDLDPTDYAQKNYDRMLINLLRVTQDAHDTDSSTQVQAHIDLLQTGCRDAVATVKTPVPANYNGFTDGVLPLFIVAAFLFTLSVIAQAVASALKKTQRSKKPE